MQSNLSNLLTALTDGDTYSALIYLQSLQILDKDYTRIPNPKPTLSNKEEHTTITKTLLHSTLPLTILSSAVTQHGDLTTQSYIRSLLTSFQINLHPLPNLHARLGEPSPTLIPDENVISNPEETTSIMEDASTALAITASTDLSELTELWNQSIDSEMQTEDVILLWKKLSDCKKRIENMEDLSSHLSSTILRTQRSVLNLYEATVKRLFHTLQIDTEERMKIDSGDRIHIQLLAARTGATMAKLKVLKAEMRAKMYTEENVNVLRNVSIQLQKRRERVVEQLEIAQRQLEECRKLGVSFEELAVSYEEAKKVLEEKVWSRNQLMD